MVPVNPWLMMKAGRVLGEWAAASAHQDFLEDQKREKERREKKYKKECARIREKIAEEEYKRTHPHCTEMFLHFDIDPEIAVDSNWKIKGPHILGGWID